MNLAEIASEFENVALNCILLFFIFLYFERNHEISEVFAYLLISTFVGKPYRKH